MIDPDGRIAKKSHMINASPSDGLLLTIPAAASYLGVPTRRLYSWIAAGRIPSAAIKRMGRALYLVRPALEDWLRSTAEPKPEMHS